jgi:hypothetical protein
MPTGSAKKHKSDKDKDKHKKKAAAPAAPAKAMPPPMPPPVQKKGGKSEPPAPPKPGAKPGVPGAPAAGAPAGKKKERKGRRREVDFAAGELLLPGGPHTVEEVQYLMRGAVAAERPAGEVAIEEIFVKRPPENPDASRVELTKVLEPLKKRFETVIEPMLPARAAGGGRRTFASVIDRARYRRREIGAFMRGLDLGRTETSHMDSHGEDSLQKLMEWAARLENLVESDEPEQADYAQFHRGLDQLENTTEALIIDVEQTLRRLRDRNRTKMEKAAAEQQQ